MPHEDLENTIPTGHAKKCRLEDSDSAARQGRFLPSSAMRIKDRIQSTVNVAFPMR